VEKIIRTYGLEDKGCMFKSDFNINFELIAHLFQINTIKGYLKIDLIKGKSSNNFYISRRMANFEANKALFETKECFQFFHKKPLKTPYTNTGI